MSLYFSLKPLKIFFSMMSVNLNNEDNILHIISWQKKLNKNFKICFHYLKKLQAGLFVKKLAAVKDIENCGQ